ncbi:arylsulfatase [Marinilabiliaceae bacterium JC017]|nr:arylsulfatase [Marinilabiliaceae bacterium JC017]
MKKFVRLSLSVLPIVSACNWCQQKEMKGKDDRPNIVIIYMDDLGYGDISANGFSSIKTPNIDRLATGGVCFENGYSTSATCTPSRYGLLTGGYPWRDKDVKILPGTAPLLIQLDQKTLPAMLRKEGYYTGIVGKWHLGLGAGNVNWIETITPGPNEVGFDYSFIMAATQDRVPTVFIENGDVVGVDSNDPIEVDYNKNFKGDPTGRDNPELLKMKWHHGHNCSIINGISRIGYMHGGKSARWVDEDMADTFLDQAQQYVKTHKDERFFLYYAMQQPHVPRTPHPRFVGKSGLGPRGDVILEADWCIGEFLKTLEKEGLMENTLIVFTSDNGPVLNDGYYDDAVEKLGDHKPGGPFRGGKYSLFEAGTHVPFIVYWKDKIQPVKSQALVSQVDLFSSLSAFVGSDLRGPDSQALMDVFLGKSDRGRASLIIEAGGRTAIRKGDWVMIPPHYGAEVNKNVNIELGNSGDYQLYNLKEDIGQQNNLADKNKETLKDMIKTFKNIRGN